MTRFEQKMLEGARTILGLSEDESLEMVICNGLNLSCSQCPIKKKCDELQARHVQDTDEMDKWLREEINMSNEFKPIYDKAYNAGKSDAKDEYTAKVYGIYAELCKEFKDNKEVMSRIDHYFGKA